MDYIAWNLNMVMNNETKKESVTAAHVSFSKYLAELN
jgi:hypothetical protein